MKAVLRRVNRTFNNRLYRQNISRAGKANWLGLSASEAFDKIVGFLETF